MILQWNKKNENAGYIALLARYKTWAHCYRTTFTKKKRSLPNKTKYTNKCLTEEIIKSYSCRFNCGVVNPAAADGPPKKPLCVCDGSTIAATAAAVDLP